MVEVKTEAVGRLGRPRYLVLGMDPGIASCGFALLDVNNHEILEMGVRLFDAPLHPKTKQSLAAIRRGFRSTRRNIDRTQDRLKHCLKCFKKYGVVPDDADKEYLHMVKGDKQPLELRVDGLNRMLTNREWGMVLYSLCKRRGYIPHGEGAQDKSSDDGKVLAAISANEKEIAAAEFKTVGEWLASRPASRNHGAITRCASDTSSLSKKPVFCSKRSARSVPRLLLKISSANTSTYAIGNGRATISISARTAWWGHAFTFHKRSARHAARLQASLFPRMALWEI